MASNNAVARLLHSYGRLTIFMIPIAIAINFVGGQIALLLKLPIYLDGIGTILVGALCGGLPGALVGLVSTALISISSPTTLAYGILTVFIGLLAGWFGRLGVYRSLWKSILSSIPYALIGGVGGALITIWLFDGLAGDGTGILVGAFVALGLDLNTANFMAQVPMDLIDKLLTVLVVFAIIKGMPKRLFVKLPLGAVYLEEPRRSQRTQAVVDGRS